MRKNLRLREYDYSSPGCYFVTICTKNKKCIFGKCVGAIHESPKTELSPCGRVAEEVICSIQERFRNVVVERYVIMPNHIHILLTITNAKESARAIRESPLRKRSTYSLVIGYLKTGISRRIHQIYGNQEEILQRGSYDHIVRCEEDYLRIAQYIDSNPSQWRDDCYFTLPLKN